MMFPWKKSEENERGKHDPECMYMFIYMQHSVPSFCCLYSCFGFGDRSETHTHSQVDITREKEEEEEEEEDLLN